MSTRSNTLSDPRPMGVLKSSLIGRAGGLPGHDSWRDAADTLSFGLPTVLSRLGSHYTNTKRCPPHNTEL